MKSSSRAVPVMAVLMLVLLVFSSPVAALTCSDVVMDIRPCLTYLKSGSGIPPKACCDGAKALASSATTTGDKQIACNCLKSASQNTGINPSLAKALPGNCGINLGFTVDPNVDCSKIS